MSLVMDAANAKIAGTEKGTRMAVEPANGTDHGDLKNHVRDYSKFTAMLKWSAIASFIIAVIVVLIISN